MKKFDAIIIGTGQAGPSLAKRFSDKNLKVAIIEQSHFGGTCVNYGCTPTKTLVANAKIAQSVRKAKDFGVVVEKFSIDYPIIKARKDTLVNESSEGLKKFLEDSCTVFEGHATFENPHVVKVGNDLLEGERIFINVGAKASIPKISGLEKIPYFTNATLLDINFVPEHLLILGGGYIGLEFAQIYRRFGSRVTVIQRRPYIMPKEDPDISTAIKKILEKEGIEICVNAENFQILPESREGSVHVQVEQNGTKKQISGSHLLIATGRTPDTENLGLEKAGVKTNSKGFIEVDDKLCTSQPHIWALGDCNGRGAFTHTSYNDYEIVAANLLDNGNRKVTDRILIYALFTDPPFGRVGMNETEALTSSYEHVLMAKMPMADVSRAREKGETDGFLKILVDGTTKHILGASFLGVECDEVIHVISVLIYAGVPYPAIEKMVNIHPTVSEFIPTLLSKLQPLHQKVMAFNETR
jgi:pyruvate/2-oxoglutarate dehydrogenase complex dihydrolipoamide dehydrogenase (E3) component